jgi:hypothetical protein
VLNWKFDTLPLVLVTPAFRSTRVIGLRPLNGSSSVCLLVITRPRTVLSV